MNLSDIFGSSHTWDDLRLLLERTLRRRFFGATTEQVEDAAADAILDLCDYWSGLASSMTADTARNWNYAKWYGTRKAGSLLYKELSRSHEVDSLDRVVYDHDESSETTLADLVAATVEAVDLTDAEYQERVAQFVEAIPDDDLHGWLSAVANGETVRAQAARERVGRMSVQRRRASGKRRLTAMAEQFGLKVA